MSRILMNAVSFPEGPVFVNRFVGTIRNSRMREVLLTIDYYSRQEPSDRFPTVEQSSSFLQISNRVIEETHITSQNGFPLRAERRI
ncbi:hypothetical protein [Granulicella sp. L60]|uniref:hypothetical protein n=1 Tax=Granulicella sp. L60 TaxID=1641866 RepID=UPI00131EB877|nr:hypothetical protein [Granulicella sp. L60]